MQYSEVVQSYRTKNSYLSQINPVRDENSLNHKFSQFTGLKLEILFKEKEMTNYFESVLINDTIIYGHVHYCHLLIL